MLADPNPPAVPAVGTTTDTASTTNIGASLTINIAGELFTLTGKFDSNDVVVEYHQPFDKAVSLGTIASIAHEIAKALSVPELETAITTTHDQVKNLKPLQSILDIITSATIRITDLVINTATQTYGVGLALDFTTSNPLPTVFDITLVSLGFNITHAKKPQA
jgi:hypothetical protein